MSIGVGPESLVHCRKPTHHVIYYRPVKELYISQKYARWKRCLSIYKPESKQIGVDSVDYIELIENSPALKIQFHNRVSAVLGTEQWVYTREGMRQITDIEVNSAVGFYRSGLIWYSAVSKIEPVTSNLYVINMKGRACTIINDLITTSQLE
jgi:wobble nucleotide-excising tRNase